MWICVYIYKYTGLYPINKHINNYVYIYIYIYIYTYTYPYPINIPMKCPKILALFGSRWPPVKPLPPVRLSDRLALADDDGGL